MTKNEILNILEKAKDKNGEIPMRLVRQAFEKLSEPCEDAVNRQAVMSAISGMMPSTHPESIDEYAYHMQEFCEEASELIYNLPSVHPERKGQWIFIHPLQKNDNRAYICSECKVGNWEIDPKSYFFCPNCGTDMRGEENETD